MNRLIPALASILIVILLALLTAGHASMIKVNPGVINPSEAPQVISINEVKEVFTLINSSLRNLSPGRVKLVYSFINYTEAAYSNGQTPQLNMKLLNDLINIISTGHLPVSSLPINTPLIKLLASMVNSSNVNEAILSGIKLLNLTIHGTGLLLITQYITILGNGTNQLINRLITANSTGGVVLTLNVTKGVAPVGSTMTIYGRLTLINGTGLSNQTILILVSGRPVAIVTTNASGFYVANVTLPYIYINETTIKAIFIPINSRLGASMAEVKVKLLFNETTLTVHVNGRDVMWGSQLVIWGNVTGGRRLIIVNASGLIINATSINGHFNVTIPTSPLKPGNLTLTITVEPHLTYAPVTRRINVTLVSIRPLVTVKGGGIYLAGFTGELTITLNPWVRGNVTLLVSMNGLNETIDADSPVVTIPIKVPLTQGIGFGIVNVTVEPNPPLEGTSVVAQLPVINIIQLIILLAAALSITLMIKLALRSRGSGETVESVMETINEAMVSMVPPAKLSNPSVRAIVDSVSKAIGVVSLSTGVSFRRGLTLREYLNLVQGKLTDPVKLRGLKGLINLAEEALYSPRLPSGEDVERALRYLAMVMGK